jgi:hypothetical protein
VGTGAESVVVGDFKGDGSHGVAVGNAISNNVSVLFNQDAGTRPGTAAARGVRSAPLGNALARVGADGSAAQHEGAVGAAAATSAASPLGPGTRASTPAADRRAEVAASLLAVRDALFRDRLEGGAGSFIPAGAPESLAVPDPWWAELDAVQATWAEKAPPLA